METPSPLPAPPIGPTFGIGVNAARIFESKLSPEKWLCRPQTPDIYVDYKIELVKEGHPSGREIAAQIKGAGKTVGSRPCKQMKVSHLQYYLYLRIPAFVFFVDTETSSVYWLFAQKYLRETVRQGRLTRFKTLKLTFDPKDNLVDLTRFELAVKTALKYVDDLYPSSIGAATQARKGQLELLDPRFEVTLDILNGKEQIRARAVAPIGLTGTFQADPNLAGKAFSALHRHGIPFTIPVANFRVQGSPLLDELEASMERGLLSVTSPQYPGALQFEYQNSSRRSQILQVEGIWTGGTLGATLECFDAASPLHYRSTVVPADWETKKTMEITLILNWDAWSEMPISSLPRFEEIFALVESLKDNRSFKIHWLSDSKRVASADGNPDLPVSDLLSKIRWIDLCREVARQLGVFPSLPSTDNLTDEIWGTAIILKKLLDNEPVTFPHFNKPLSIPIHASKKPIHPDTHRPPAELPINHFRMFDFLGREVKPRVLTIFSEVVLEAVKGDRNDPILKFRSSPACEQSIVLLRDEYGEPVLDDKSESMTVRANFSQNFQNNSVTLGKSHCKP